MTLLISSLSDFTVSTHTTCLFFPHCISLRHQPNCWWFHQFANEHAIAPLRQFVVSLIDYRVMSSMLLLIAKTYLPFQILHIALRSLMQYPRLTLHNRSKPICHHDYSTSSRPLASSILLQLLSNNAYSTIVNVLTLTQTLLLRRPIARSIFHSLLQQSIVYFLSCMFLNRLLAEVHSTITLLLHQDTISFLDYCSYTHKHKLRSHIDS